MVILMQHLNNLKFYFFIVNLMIKIILVINLKY